MLDVGLGGSAGGAEVEHVLVGDEFGEVGGDFGLPAAGLLHVSVAFAGAFLLLDGFYGGGEGDVAGVGWHEARSDWCRRFWSPGWWSICGVVKLV